MRSKNKSMLALAVTYLGIWAFSLIVFWCFISGSDAMGYALLFLIVLLPVTTFVTSFRIGKQNYGGKWKWSFAIAFGIMYMLADYMTFSMANMLTVHRVNFPALGMIPAGAVISFVGMGLGVGIRYMASKRKNSTLI